MTHELFKNYIYERFMFHSQLIFMNNACLIHGNLSQRTSITTMEVAHLLRDAPLLVDKMLVALQGV